MRNKKYRCSEARSEALQRLEYLQKGANAASKKTIPNRVRSMTYHSAIFQASSTLEEYLKQIFDHWLFELKRLELTGNNIPPRARFSYIGREFSEDFNKFGYGGDEKTLAEALQEKSNIIDFAMGYSTIPAHLTGEFAYKNKKYPSPKNIKSLYTRIGCDNIFDRLSKEMRSNAELKLRGFNDIRTSIAHGTPPDITIIDVKRNLADISLLIKALDRVSHKEFSKDFGGGVW